MKQVKELSSIEYLEEGDLKKYIEEIIDVADGNSVNCERRYGCSREDLLAIKKKKIDAKKLYYYISERISARSAQALLLRVKEGLTYSEIGERLNCSHTTISRDMNILKRKLPYYLVKESRYYIATDENICRMIRRLDKETEDNILDVRSILTSEITNMNRIFINVKAENIIGMEYWKLDGIKSASRVFKGSNIKFVRNLTRLRFPADIDIKDIFKGSFLEDKFEVIDDNKIQEIVVKRKRTVPKVMITDEDKIKVLLKYIENNVPSYVLKDVESKDKEAFLIDYVLKEVSSTIL